jgi:hypothetical protein
MFWTVSSVKSGHFVRSGLGAGAQLQHSVGDHIAAEGLKQQIFESVDL